MFKTNIFWAQQIFGVNKQLWGVLPPNAPSGYTGLR